MNEKTAELNPGAAAASKPGVSKGSARWNTPSVEVISLSCEISAYAPDEDGWPPF